MNNTAPTNLSQPPYSPGGSTSTPGGSSVPFSMTNPPFAQATGAVRPAASGGDLSFGDLIELIRHVCLVIRAKWLWGMVGALLVAGPIGYYLFNRPVTYLAQTSVLAQSTLDKVIGTAATEGMSSEQLRENNLRNHLSMMTSRKFQARLAEAFSQEEKTLIARPYGEEASMPFIREFLENFMDVERERGREYYTISVRHRDAQVAVMMADRAASEYLLYVQAEYKDASQRGYALLEKQAESIRADIAKVESERLDFRKKNGIISRADNQSILTERLKRLDANLTEIRVKRRGLETLALQAIIDRSKSKYPWDNSYLAGFANNENLRQEWDRQVAQRAVLASRYGPNHPKMRDIDSQISAIEASIQRNFDLAVSDLQAQLAVATQNEKLLQKEFDESFASSIEIEKLATTYEILSAGVESKKITLNELEKKIGEASISSRLPADFMQIIDPAYIAKRRIPREVLYMAMVLVVALGMFVVSPLLVSALDERVNGTSDVEKVLGLPLMGGIPKLKGRPEDRAHIVRNKLDLITAESFISVVGYMEVGSMQRGPRVILVTSTLPAEGKSVVASNLASTFTQLGKRVMLVDFDLRRPTQHSLHGVVSEKGLLSWARAGFSLEQNLLAQDGPLGVRKLVDGTELICAGGHEAQPSQYLVADHTTRLFERLSKAYDIIIVDTPPAGVFQDAMILSRLATERILVARDEVAPVVQVKKVIDDFARAEFPFRGLLLNGFNPCNANKKLSYGYKAAAKGYASYKPEQVKRTARPTAGKA